MKASEVIERLQSLIAEHGDMEVGTYYEECYSVEHTNSIELSRFGDNGKGDRAFLIQ
jgi:hypothetical protein